MVITKRVPELVVLTKVNTGRPVIVVAELTNSHRANTSLRQSFANKITFIFGNRYRYSWGTHLEVVEAEQGREGSTRIWGIHSPTINSRVIEKTRWGYWKQCNFWGKSFETTTDGFVIIFIRDTRVGTLSIKSGEVYEEGSLISSHTFFDWGDGWYLMEIFMWA